MEDSLKKLEIYRLAHELLVKAHRMTLGLPSFERFEEGSQTRRSSKRVSASIVEGHAYRRYKGQYVFYLNRALGSSDETQEHLLILRDTGSLTDAGVFQDLLSGYEQLSKKLFRFVSAVERNHQTPNYLQNAGPEEDAEEPNPEVDDQGCGSDPVTLD